MQDNNLGRAQHTPAHGDWTMRETAHLNGGKDWFGYKHQCIEQPRLSRLDRYLRKDRSVTSTWRVDGGDCASFEDALDQLESPPSMTIADLDAVSQFTAAEMGKADFADFQATYPALRTLADKGLVWWQAGRVRLLFDALLAAIGSTESNSSGNPSFDAFAPRCASARAAIAKARDAQPLPESSK